MTESAQQRCMLSSPLAPDRILGILSHKLHYVHNGAYYTTGGFTDYVEGVAAHFKHTVVMVPVATTTSVAGLRRVSCEGYRIHPLPPFIRRTAGAYLAGPYIRREVRRAFVACDVVNLFMFSANALVAVPELEAMQKPIAFALVGEAFFPRKAQKGLKAMIARRMEEACRRHLTFVYGWHLVDIHHLDPAKCVTLYSSSYHLSDIRTDPITPPGPGERIRLIYVGRIDGMKGVDVLLQALAALGAHRSRFQLDIVGDGPARASREKLARRLGLSESVTFHGYVPHGNRWRELMEAAHVMTFVSLHEGAPKTVIEALQFGLPVLASRVGAIPSVIEEGVNGMLVDPGDVAATARSLRKALEWEGAAWLAMSRANLQRAGDYTIEGDAAKVVCTLRDRGLLDATQE